MREGAREEEEEGYGVGSAASAGVNSCACEAGRSQMREMGIDWIEKHEDWVWSVESAPRRCSLAPARASHVAAHQRCRARSQPHAVSAASPSWLRNHAGEEGSPDLILEDLNLMLAVSMQSRRETI
jgi:hypothetical protein